MNEQTNSDGAFHLVEEEARIARTARMLDDNERLKPNQRADIIQRCQSLIEDMDFTQAAIARELAISSSTMSGILNGRLKGQTGDKHLARLHNWMELTARRDTIVRSKKWVETSVAREILSVARTCAETCKIAVIFGPA